MARQSEKKGIFSYSAKVHKAGDRQSVGGTLEEGSLLVRYADSSHIHLSGRTGLASFYGLDQFHRPAKLSH